MTKILLWFFFLSFTSITSLHASDQRALLFRGNCTTCHFEHITLSAPSVQKFKESYLSAFPIKKDFIEYMSQWVFKPNKKNSIMPDDIKKHGLMPELGYDISTLKEISAYIFETDFSKIDDGHQE